MVYRSDGLSLLLDRPPLHHIALLGQLLLLLFFLFSSLFSSTTPTGRCITGGARQQPVIRLFPSAGNVFLIYILPLIDSIKTPTLLATRQRAVELTSFSSLLLPLLLPSLSPLPFTASSPIHYYVSILQSAVPIPPGSNRHRIEYNNKTVK